jgi:hypothetical protein
LIVLSVTSEEFLLSSKAKEKYNVYTVQKRSVVLTGRMVQKNII